MHRILFVSYVLLSIAQIGFGEELWCGVSVYSKTHPSQQPYLSRHSEGLTKATMSHLKNVQINSADTEASVTFYEVRNRPDLVAVEMKLSHLGRYGSFAGQTYKILERDIINRAYQYPFFLETRLLNQTSRERDVWTGKEKEYPMYAAVVCQSATWLP